MLIMIKPSALCNNKIFFTGFKFNDEEAAKVNEAKKIQKWVGTWCPFNARFLGCGDTGTSSTQVPFL